MQELHNGIKQKLLGEPYIYIEECIKVFLV